MIGFIIGCFVGAFVAIIVMGCCIASKTSEMTASYLNDSKCSDCNCCGTQHIDNKSE